MRTTSEARFEVGANALGKGISTMYYPTNIKCRAISEESIRKACVAALQQELAVLEKDLASTMPTTQSAVEQLAKTEC